MKMMRCNTCVLPDNYPGIKFDQEGKCNFCTSYRPIEYLGAEKLREKIIALKKESKNQVNADYDCVLGLSGGRDSSYLLYFLSKALNLRVLAYSAEHGLIPESTKQNIIKMTDKLKVRSEIQRNDLLDKCFEHHWKSWLAKPSPAMLGLLCVGCRVGYDFGILNFARKMRVPVLVEGGTPYEGLHFKLNLLRINPNREESSIVRGFINQLARNPKWLSKLSCIPIQTKEFYYHYYRRKKHFHKKLKKAGLVKVRPYNSFIRWKEDEVVAAIRDEFGWEKSEHSESTWRGDCYVALIRDYFFYKTLGFNDKDDHFSSLIRDGQISREEALRRLDEQKKSYDQKIASLFDTIGLALPDAQFMESLTSGHR